MTTTDVSMTEAPPQEVSPGRRSTRVWIVAIVGLLGLVVGGLAGWVMRGDDSSDEAGIVVAGGDEPTSRQELMVEFHRDYIDAWKTGDVEAIRAMYVPDGTYTFNGFTYDVASTEFADFVGLYGPQGDHGTISEPLEPHLVKGTTMLNFVEVVGNSSENTLRFTPTGELLLVEHVIVNSSLS